jgi:MinD-like ATPase involved in chromosome partitioning or flagellar assembly
MPVFHPCCAAACRFNITRKHMEQLVESIQSLGYHYVMIDCPAGIDVGFINAISPAKEALIVTTPEITSIRCVLTCSMLCVGPAHKLTGVGHMQRQCQKRLKGSNCVCAALRACLHV